MLDVYLPKHFPVEETLNNNYFFLLLLKLFKGPTDGIGLYDLNISYPDPSIEVSSSLVFLLLIYDVCFLAF